MNNACKLLWLVALLCACSASRYMTQESFSEVTIGEKISNIQTIAGRPYEIKEISQHKQEYVYIERISIGDDRELFRRYILTVEHGVVVDKRVKEESTPAIQLYG